LRAAHAAGNEKTIKVALVGCGGRGTGAAAQALSTAGPVQLWAMADAFENRLEISRNNLIRGQVKKYDREQSGSLAERIDVPPERRFVGLNAYRQAIDSDIDVVILAGPPGFRPRHFQYAVQAGKHVFMEKPVATDAPGIRQVLVAAEQAKRQNLKVGVGLQRHHQPSYLQAMRRIHDGALGDILALRCYWNTGQPAKKPMPRKHRTELEYQVRNWYFFAWLSGDHICEQHVHNLDVCNWIMQDHPLQAEGMGGRQVRTGKEYGNIFDHHAVEFTYAGGTKLFSQCRQIQGCAKQVAEFAQGTKAIADLATNACRIRQGDTRVWSSERPRPAKRVNPYQAEHDALFEAIRRDKPYNEAENGALSTMTAILGRLATYSGKVVTWDEAIASDIKLTTDDEDWSAAPPVCANNDGYYPTAIPGVSRVV